MDIKNEYTSRQIGAAMLCAGMLKRAYARGKKNGGSVDWEDLDMAHERALVAMQKPRPLKPRKTKLLKILVDLAPPLKAP
jgi:hypothetical protein